MKKFNRYHPEDRSLQPEEESLQTEEESLQLKEKSPQSYHPVSCAMHSEIELAIMHGNKLQVRYIHSGTTRVSEIQPRDVVTRKKQGEFLLARDKSGKLLEIRLDTIQDFCILQ